MNKTPFCNMCFKAGKPASEYKSHRLYNKASVVVCPYLLSIECRYCHEKGHTKSHCPILKMRRYLREKYDVSGLPPVPARVMPLVMPEHCKTKTQTQTQMKTQTQTKVCEQEPEEEHYDSSDDEWPLASREKTTKKRMNWADICESDVEDDEF